MAIVQFVREHALLRRLIILSWHAVGLCLTYYAAFWLRFDGAVPAPETALFWRTLPVLVFVSLALFSLFRLHSGMWSFFSFDDLQRVLAALGASTLAFGAFVFLMLEFSFRGFPRSVFVVYLLLMGTWMLGGRLLMRAIRERRFERVSAAPRAEKRVLLVGGLEDAEQALRGLQGADGETATRFVGILTDEASAYHLTIRGVRIFGPVTEVGRLARQLAANVLLILPPCTRPKPMNQLVDDCEKAGVACSFQMIPSLAELAAGRVTLSSIRKVEIEDLLGRPEITFNRQAVRDMVAGKIVLITGAGGSIGSELARQIAHYDPALLVLFEASEYNLYAIDMELRRTMPRLKVAAVAGDIGHVGQVRTVLRQHGVQLIYHAAAYKHVPLMEDNVAACVLNNTIGTARLVEQAEQGGVERFVLISSDKAVRPTSVMGATKRLAERLLQERPPSKTRFASVRFGNVLGSSGSVIPLFRQQIEAGGPVTVTSPEMTRFFMSIPEAVDLVLQAGAIGHDRAILVLEMGESIRIVDLARRLIELSGLRVDEDIEIVFTGKRPGEKEYEELMTDDENVVRTPYDKIWVMQKKAADTATPLDLAALERLVEAHDDAGLRRELMRLIPDARPEILGRRA